MIRLSSWDAKLSRLTTPEKERGEDARNRPEPTDRWVDDEGMPNALIGRKEYKYIYIRIAIVEEGVERLYE